MSQAISKANAMLGDMQLKSTQLVPLELIPFNLDIELGIQGDLGEDIFAPL